MSQHLSEEALRAGLAPTIGDKSFKLPPPRLNPDDRKQRRLAFRNERNLYRRICDLTGEEILSMYSPDKPFKVYGNRSWWTDAWDAKDYGRAYDFTRPFFEQFKELRDAAPRIALVKNIKEDENRSVYVNFAGQNKSCYMIFDSDVNEDSLYSNVLKHSKSCVDCSYVQRCELCFECIDCQGCYNLRYSKDCTNCSDSAFLDQCIGCRDCFFCCNLSQKQYCIENKQFSREDYLSRISRYQQKSREAISNLQRKFTEYRKNYPRKYAHIIKGEDCSGDYIANSRRCISCYNVGNAEDLYYCDAVYQAKSCMDVSSFGENIERVYEGGTIGINSYNIYFCFACISSNDLLYCDGCVTSHNCFGCASMRAADYAVLNRAYTRHEYETLVPRIIAHMRETGEWGEYFPLSLSGFGYNETIAQELFPLTKREALALGAHWSDYNAPRPAVETVPAATIPDWIDDAEDDLLSKAFECPETGKPFRISKAELLFYRRNNLPVAAVHPDERHIRRIIQRNPQALWQRSCAVCEAALLSPYAPMRPEQVLCEEHFARHLAEN